MAVHLHEASPGSLTAELLGTEEPVGLGRFEVTGTTNDWRTAFPVLHGLRLTLREPRLADAASLLAMLNVEEVARFISPPPTSVDDFQRFIAWSAAERQQGHGVCFVVVPEGSDVAVGLFQVRRLGPTFEMAEWGFAIGSPFWGTGLFVEGARLVLDFVFGVIGVHRLEARSMAANGRGNGALRKIGAVHEAVLRRAFRCRGALVDQSLWSILQGDYWLAKAVWTSTNLTSPSSQRRPCTRVTRGGRRPPAGPATSSLPSQFGASGSCAGATCGR
jgi:RimJ/RimL family protein N-acetyltransferase